MVGIRHGAVEIGSIFQGETEIARGYRGNALFYQVGLAPVIAPPTLIADGYIASTGVNVANNVNVDVGPDADPDRLFVICATFNKSSTSITDGQGRVDSFAGLIPQGALTGYVGSDNNFTNYFGAINIGLLTGVQVLALWSGWASDTRYRVYRFSGAAVKNFRYKELLASALGLDDQLTMATNDLAFGMASREDLGAGVNLVTETETLRKDSGYSYYHPPLLTSRTQEFEIAADAAGVQTLTLPTNGSTRARVMAALQISAVNPDLPPKAALTEVPVFYGIAPDSVNRTYKVNVGDEDPGRWFVLLTSKARAGTSGSMTTWSATLDGQAFTSKILVADNRGQYQVGVLRLPTGTGIKDLFINAGTGGEVDVRLFKVNNADLLSHLTAVATTGAPTTAALALSATCGIDDLLIGYGMIRDLTETNVFVGDPQRITPEVQRTMNGGAFRAQHTAKVSAGGSDGFSVKATAASVSKALHMLRFREYTPFTSKIRSQSVVGGNGATLNVPWPAGTVAGDRVIIFLEGGYSPSAAPAGWTSHSLLTGSFVGGGIFSKVMDAADILAGSVTLGYSGSPYGNSAAALCCIGAPAVAVVNAARDVANGSSLALAGALADDQYFFYTGVRDGAAGTGTVDTGETLIQGDFATNQAHSRVVQGRVYEAGTITGVITHGGRAYFGGIILR